jgi:hypothetical protein
MSHNGTGMQMRHQIFSFYDILHSNLNSKGTTMKSLLALLVLAATSGLVHAQTTPSISGNWKIHTVMVQESNSTCTFTQKEKELTGACEGDNGKFNITGKVEGDKVTWSFKTDYNGSPLTVSYEGKLESDSKMSGSASVAELSLDGDFTAVKDTETPAK